MGCVESRKLIENVTGGDIKTVYHVEDVFGDKNRPGKETEIKCELRDDSTNLSDRTRSERSTNKVKIKTKYDPRITAKYEVKAHLGSGTFSKVVRVENKQTKQPYAIKIIESKEGREAFEAELAILRRVKCPYIIKLIEVFESVDNIYMVMELATGGDLFEKVRAKGPFSETEAVGVLKMVLEGVRYLHKLGITHRDLKLENILYYHPGADSRLMITDFGLAHARKSAGATKMTTICGTPEYIAPEMVAWRPYTNAVDLWAVGVISYILLRGDFPFYDNDRKRLYKKILRGSYNMDDEVWEQVSECGRDFVQRLLELDPELRLTARDALAHPWIKTHSHPSGSSPHPSQRAGSGESLSRKSSHSSKSGRSTGSLRTGRKRVRPRDIEGLAYLASATTPSHHHHHHHSPAPFLP